MLAYGKDSVPLKEGRVRPFIVLKSAEQALNQLLHRLLSHNPYLELVRSVSLETSSPAGTPIPRLSTSQPLPGEIMLPS